MKKSIRIDDYGAATKYHEVYSKKMYGVANFWFLKRLNFFKAWAPYPETTAEEMYTLIDILQAYNARATLAVTASWVQNDGSITPFPYKFPALAAAIAHGVQLGILEVASHGLTHCVLYDNAFKPRFNSSNRSAHREFWDWLPYQTHYQHLYQSKKILEDYFCFPITTLVPPGNVYSQKTIDAALDIGFKCINCNTTNQVTGSLNILNNDNVYPLHDRDFLNGNYSLLHDILSLNTETEFVFIRDLCVL